MSIVAAMVSRADSWVNALTGLGTLRDKLTHAQITPGVKLSDTTLESLYNDDDLAKRLVKKLPREATRRGFELALEGTTGSDSADRAREIMDQWKLLGCMPKLRKAWIWGRLYAGGAVFVGADDGLPLEQKLDENAIKDIRFLTVFKRPELSVHTKYQDVREPKFGEPELYKVHAQKTVGGPLEATDYLIHETRLIMFEGEEAARTSSATADGFEDSVLQAVHEQIRNCATAWQSVAHLLSDASQGVLAIDGLVDLIAAKGQETLRTRIQLMDLARSVCRSILVDAERERFERVATSFAGIPEVLDRLMMRAAAAFEMPVTILFGRSPAGMNATGESDIRGWYDTVSDEQTETLKPRVERLLRLLMLAKNSPTKGVLPTRWEVNFRPLWQPTDKEVAEVKKIKADTHKVLIDGQIIFPAESALELAADFPTIDQEHRRALLEGDLDEGLRPGEGGEDDEELDDDDEEGGGDSTGPKGRSDRLDKKGAKGGADAQPRKPKGSPEGGQFASTGGASGGGGINFATTPHGSLESLAKYGKTPEIRDQAAAEIKRRGGSASAPKTPAQATPTKAEQPSAATTSERVGGFTVHAGPTGASKLELAEHSDKHKARAEEAVDHIAGGHADKRTVNSWGGETPAAVAATGGDECGKWARDWTDGWVMESTHERVDSVLEDMRKPGSASQVYYHATQAHMQRELKTLQRQGIADADGYLNLYRGIGGKQAEAFQGQRDVTLHVRGLSSWTSSARTAKEFATQGDPKGVVVKQRVHHSRVFAAHTANITFHEHEAEYALLAPERKIAVSVHR